MRKHSLTENTIKEIVERIVSLIKPEKIILFGSYAYGKVDINSDIDLLVIKQGLKSKIDTYLKIRTGLKGIRFPFDIIVVSPEEYEFYSLKWKNSVFAEARKKGLVIYGE